jgi:iron complex transport system substrate-binding protein
MRIVSLIASSTEMVCALGRGDDLVGRSHECDHPSWVRGLPPVTAPKFPTDGTSYQIDQRIKAILQEGLSVYRVDAAALDALAPDVILTQDQCRVCAVSVADVEAAVCELVRSRPRIVSLEPNLLEDIWRDLQKVADALDVPERGRELVAELRARMDAVRRPWTARPTVACIEWIDPLMYGANWMPELVERAGGTPVAGPADVAVVMPCGFDLARTRAELAGRDVSGWGRRVVLADGNAFFNRPGPRIAESLEILAEIVHPEIFGAAHEGGAWERA